MDKVIKQAIDTCITFAIKQKRLNRLTEHICVSAIICKDGNIIYGLNVPKSGVICAEMVALGEALLEHKGQELLYILTISVDEKREPYILSMCGNCRQNLYYACPQIKVLMGNLDNYYMVSLEDLLPSPYMRKSLMEGSDMDETFSSGKDGR